MMATVTSPTTDEELYWAVRLLTGAKLSRKAVCAGHVAPFRAFADAYFGRSPITVWKASRGFGGKSYLLALLAHMENVFLGAEAAILGGSGEQAKRVTAYVGEFWGHPHAPCTEAYAPGDPRADGSSPELLLVGQAGGLRTTLSNGGRTTCLMASQRSVRGSHQPRSRLDEIDEMNLSIFDSAMGQTMTQKGVSPQTVASSTHQNANGTMTEVLRRAVTRGWPIYEWCYRENVGVWLDATEVEVKRQQVTEAMWQTEYELQEPNPEGRAINSDAVDRMFNIDYGEWDAKAGVEMVFEEPKQGAAYATGADWAKTSDWTIIVTFRTDVRPWRVVAFLKDGRKPWPEMVKRFDSRLARYGGRAAHDATGLGSVVHDYMATANATAVVLGGQNRSSLLSNYIAFVENEGGVECPRIVWAYGEHKYASYADVFASGSQFHLPDTICAFALAHYAATHGAGEWSKSEPLLGAGDDSYGAPLFDPKKVL